MELNPQQQEFLANYTNPNSETFGNAYRSAIKVKYSKEYAENITNQLPNWLSENLGRTKRLKKAEKILDDTLDYTITNEEGKPDAALLRIQTDVAKFLAERIGKTIYSTRTEHTGEGGGSITLKWSDGDNDTLQSEEVDSGLPSEQ